MNLVITSVETCPECGCDMDGYFDKEIGALVMCCNCEYISRPAEWEPQENTGDDPK